MAAACGCSSYSTAAAALISDEHKKLDLKEAEAGKVVRKKCSFLLKNERENIAYKVSAGIEKKQKFR